MKNTQALITLMSFSLLAACGEYSKNPVGDIKEMRQHGNTEIQMGPDKPREIVTPPVVVEKKVPVYIQQSTIDQNSVVLKPDTQMFFNEGQSSQFKIRANVLVPDVKIGLKVSGLPNDAKVEESKTEKGTYLLTWTPGLYTVTSNSAFKAIKAKATIEILSGNDAKQVAALRGLNLSEDFSVIVSKNQEVPSGLTVEGIKTEVQEGSLTPFTVTVKVPGVDKNSPTKPTLNIRYDGVAVTPGNSFQELDGSRHIILDMTKLEPVYLGEFKWQFTRIFDTKNIQVQPQTAKDGSVLKNADGTRVRLSLKVISPNNTSTAESLLQVKVRYDKPISAPRFDVSGVGQQALEVARGQKITLNFFVASGDEKAVVKVEQAKSTLPGAPAVECKDSAAGAAKQDCVMTWSVPCDTQDSKLAGEIAMTAVSVVEGRNSDVTSYKLKVLASKEDKKLCSAEAAK